ncbi:MAG: ribonuclease III [Phenylobacterium sp.]|uniref:ribonuclease III n=1 Tax=Phenylobacterium sp. TaxID=1871053 RepID=UPI00391C0F88
MNRRQAAVAELETLIGRPFGDPALLEQALTHASVGEGAVKVAHNEQLEFLGDRVLNLLAAEALMRRHGEAREGELSRMVAALVNYQTCARVARRIGLPAAMRLSASASKIGARDNDSILGDAAEALIGAIYQDAGLDAAREFFARFWDEEIERLDAPRVKDSKTALQEWAQGRGLPLPAYRIVGREGPDHAPDFTVEVAIEGFAPVSARGRSKQEAEKSAARLMLQQRESGL